MNMLWQDAMALIAAAVAAVYVMRRLWRLGRSRRTFGCGGGAGCSKTADARRPTLLNLTKVD